MLSKRRVGMEIVWEEGSEGQAKKKREKKNENENVNHA